MAVLLAASFLALAVAMAWERPLCCVDDAAYAVVAKNLASGHGYRATFGPELDRPFAPWIGTGPTSIVPVAAAIAVFGPDARVPGIAHILLWLVLLLLAVRAATRLGARPWELLAGFLALQLATSAWHFEHWYALLGEVPAALLVILGGALLAREDASRRELFASGLAFAAATLGKLLTALYLIGPFLLLARTLLHGPKGRSPAGARRTLALLAGLLLPHAAFELWKLSVLGLAGWWDNAKRLVAFVIGHGTGDAPAAGWTELAHRAALLDEHFVVSPLLLAATIGLAGLAWRRLPPAASRLLLLLLLGVGVHLVYWLFVSNGWPRYAYVATIVWGFALAFLVATVRGAPLRLGLAALVAGTLAGGLPRMERPLRMLAEARQPETSEIAAARAVAAAIRTRTGGASVAAPSWGHAATLEYLSDEPGRFDIAPARRPVGYLVVDDRLPNPAAAGLFAGCERKVSRRAPYTLRRCRVPEDGERGALPDTPPAGS